VGWLAFLSLLLSLINFSCAKPFPDNGVGLPMDGSDFADEDLKNIEQLLEEEVKEDELGEGALDEGLSFSKEIEEILEDDMKEEAEESNGESFPSEDKEEILNIPGMEEKPDGFYFKGEKVKSITPIGDKGEPGVARSLEVKKYGSKKNDQDKLKELGDIESIDEIVDMLPIESMKEIKSLKEVLSMEEIDEDIAEEFIKEHGLSNLVAESQGHSDTPLEKKLKGAIQKDTEIEEVIENEIQAGEAKIEALEEKEEKIDSMLESVIEKEEIKLDELQNKKKYVTKEKGLLENKLKEVANEVERILNKNVSSVKGVKNIQKIKSMKPVKSIQEVKRITPIKSIKEAKNIYELTDSQARKLKSLLKEVENKKRKRMKRRRRN